MKQRVPIIIWLVGLLACVVIVMRAQYTADMSAFLPQRPSPTQQLLVEQLREGNLSRLVLIGIEGADAATRARLSKELAARLSASGEFAGVQNGDAAALAKDRELLFANRYLLSPAVTKERFGVDGLREGVSESIDLLASPAGMMVKSLLPRDPTGELMSLLGELGASAGTGTGGPAMDHGVWASRDGSRALLMAQTAAPGSDTEAQERALARLRSEFAGLQDNTARLLVAGAPVFAVEARSTIKGEVERLAVASTVGIVTLLLVVYRSFAALTLGLLPVLSGALAGIAAVSLGFGEVHGITIGFGTTLIGEAVDYSIYYFVQSRNDAEDDWRARFWPTIRLGVLTSLCGFASLLFSGFPGLAQLGLYSMAGLVVAAAVTRFVLPSLRPRSFHIRDSVALGRAFGRAMAPLTRLARSHWPALLLALAALTILFAKQDQLWNKSLADLSPMSPATMALDASLRGELGAPDQRYLVVITAATREEALVAAECMAERMKPLVEQGLIAGFETPTRFLPSEATQRARQAALPERAELERRLRDALADLPLRAEKLSPFLDDVEAARHQPLLTAEAFKGSSLGLAVDSMLMRRVSGWSALLPVRGPAEGDADVKAINAAIDDAPTQGGAADAVFLDLGGESNRLYSEYLREAIWLSLAGLAAIVVLLAASLRSGRPLLRVLRTLAPLVLAVLLVMAGLALAGERMNLLHLVGLLLTVAVGSNYALFFDSEQQDGAAAGDPRTLTSLLIANATTVMGFGILALSSVPVLHAMGITVGPGAVLALLLSAMLSGRRG